VEVSLLATKHGKMPGWEKFDHRGQEGKSKTFTADLDYPIFGTFGNLTRAPS
jgi:hypothetical protein